MSDNKRGRRGNEDDDNDKNFPAATNTSRTGLASNLRNLVAGGFAGALAKTVVAPVDRIKILYQVTSAEFRLRDVPSVAGSIIKGEGWTALWKGHGAAVIRVFPYAGIQFAVYEECKVHFSGERRRRRPAGSTSNSSEEEQRQRLQRIRRRRLEQPRELEGGDADECDDGNDGRWREGRIRVPAGKEATADEHRGGLSPAESLISGMVAGSVSVMCTYPLDAARAQLAVLRKGHTGGIATGGRGRPAQALPTTTANTTTNTKKGLGYVLRSSYRNGGVGGLYRGIAPTLLGILPYSGMAFAFNEQAKRRITQTHHREPTTSERLQCGALSGLIAQSVTYPLEVTRRRMQTAGVLATMAASSTSSSSSFAGADSSLATGNLAGLPSRTAAGGGGGVTSLPTATAKTAAAPSMVQTMRALFDEQGARGFFKGLSINWIKGPVAFGISFTAFDAIRGWIEEFEADAEEAKLKATVEATHGAGAVGGLGGSGGMRRRPTEDERLRTSAGVSLRRRLTSDEE